MTSNDSVNKSEITTDSDSFDKAIGPRRNIQPQVSKPAKHVSEVNSMIEDDMKLFINFKRIAVPDVMLKKSYEFKKEKVGDTWRL